MLVDRVNCKNDFYGHAFIKFLSFQNSLLSFDELVIGAPMYTDYRSEPIGIERGRVYVFNNTGVSHGWLV